MSLSHLFPVIEPDYGQLDRVLRREVPDRIPLVELFADRDFVKAVLGYGAEDMAPDKTLEFWQRNILWRTEFQKVVGADYVNLGMPWMEFPNRRMTMAANTAALSGQERGWVNESDGVINSPEDLEAYPWPEDDFAAQSDAFFDFAAEHVPEGMGIIANTAGVLEWTMWLMGFAPFCMALIDAPEFAHRVVDRIGARLLAGYERAAAHPAVKAAWYSDDMGYKTAPMISPEHFRGFIFPWQKRIVEAVHAQNKPVLLHSCGNLLPIMNDLIEHVGFDAKHSFEDVIQPVADFKRQYGHRIATLGGIDVDVLARRTPDEVRASVRSTLEACAPGGGYGCGSGNSVTNYIPVENYAALVNELAAFNRRG
jgi:uroporphyrinogen decarboxylase